jgi:hypothetical protein
MYIGQEFRYGFNRFVITGLYSNKFAAWGIGGLRRNKTVFFDYEMLLVNTQE